VSTPRTPKRFGETAAAKVDVTPEKNPPLSDLAGRELMILGWSMQKSKFGEYAVLRIKQRGGEPEEVNTSSKIVLKQLQAMEQDDYPFVAWLHQGKGENKPLWFSDQAPELQDLPVGKRGD
jgi:hypothetical protein